jgi:hypothetical protein
MTDSMRRRRQRFVFPRGRLRFDGGATIQQISFFALSHTTHNATIAINANITTNAINLVKETVEYLVATKRRW